jgi:polyferredoxin
VTLDVADASFPPRRPPRVDLLRWPVLGPFLRWRHARLALQLPLLALAALLVWHGLAGPRFAPKNLATVLVWVHYRGALVLALLIAGNLFCMACPFLVARDLARRVFRPRLDWPRPLRNKWTALVLIAAVLFAYEQFDWWSSPPATALLVAGFFAAAFVVDALFKHAAFCKFVCPIGQFNFAASTLSPLEIRVSDHQVCARCATRDCIRGRHGPAGRLEVRGCELALFQPLKHGNVDCTFCLDCVHACPHDNVALAPRLPGRELWEDPQRSGIGWFSRRPDLAALVIVFTFGALLNAFGMVSPVYAVQAWIAARLPAPDQSVALGILFGVALVIEPAILLGLAAWATRRATGARERLVAVAVRHAYALVPLGFGVWLAHYAFHFLTGFLTFVPVAQKALVDLGTPLLGEPVWTLGGLSTRAVLPIEVGFLVLGLIGSWIVGWRIAEREAPGRATRAFLPWAALALLLFVTAWWLLSQPMEMRGTIGA